MPNVVDILIEEGLQKGLEKGLQEGRQEGLQKGLEKGLQEGRQEGLQEGRQKTRKEDVSKLLAKGVLTPEQIASALDLDLSWVLEIQAEIVRKS